MIDSYQLGEKEINIFFLCQITNAVDFVVGLLAGI